MPSPPRFSDLCVDLLRGGTAVRFTATGSSMWPTIREGDAITVEPVRATGDLAVGDVVLYRAARGLTAHRLVGRSPDALRVRGDAPGSPDERVADGHLLGRVGTVERDGRERPLRRAGWIRRLAWRLAAGFRPAGESGSRDRRWISH